MLLVSDSTMFLLIECGILLTLVYIVSFYLLKPYLDPKRKNLPPGPTGIPIFGYAPFFPSNYGPTLKQLFAKYGKIISMRLGSYDVVFISDFDVMKKVTRLPEFNDRPDFNIFSNLPVPTMVAWNGEQWKEQRKFSLRIMRDLGMGRPEFEDAILDEVQDLMATIEKQVDKPVKIHPLVGSSASSVMNHMIMGNRLTDEHPDRKLVDQSFLSRGGGMRPPMFSSVFYMPFVSYLMRRLPTIRTTPAQRFTENFVRVSNYIRRRFNEVKEQFKSKEGGNVSCFMEAYLKELSDNKSGKYFDDEHLIGNAFAFFSAGSNTTGDFLTWFFLFMMIEPASQRKLRQEVDDVIGSNRPSVKHRESMPFTEAVIHEVHRIASTTPSGLPHAVSKEVELEGYFLQKGTQVILCNHAVHTDPDYFDHQDDFIPERFISKEGKFVRNEKVMPFGIGKRSCPGEPIANMEIFLYVTSFLQKFEMDIPKGRRYTSEGENDFLGRIPADSPIEVVFKRRV